MSVDPTTTVFMRIRLDTSHAAEDGKAGGEVAGKEFGDGFKKESGGKLKGVQGEIVQDMGKAGSDAGKSFGDGFTRDSSGRLRDAKGKFVKDFGQAGADAGKAFGSGFGDEASKTIRDVGKAGKNANNDLADFGSTIGKLGNVAMPALIGAGVALSPVLVTVGVGAAGLAVAAASTVAPLLKAAGAAGGLEKNLSTLSPVQQLMGRQLLGLKGEADQFSKSLQPQVVKLWGDGLGIAGNVLRTLQPIAKNTGNALHDVLTAINANFQTQQWHDFFGFMAQNAGPDTKLLGQNLIDLVNILPQLLTNLQPVAVELLQATDATFKLVSAIEKLDTASVHLGDSSQHSASWISIVGNAVKNAAQQMLPAGGAVLPAVSKGLGAISTTSPTAAKGITAVAKAAQAASPVVGTLSGDLAILATTTSNSDLALKAFSDTWNIFVGKAVTDQQAVLNLKQAFESYTASVKSSGRASTTTQQAFLSIFTTIGNGLDALHKNGASVQQLNAFYQTSIARLQALHGLTPLQRQDIQGLTKDYLVWANSVAGVSGNVVKASRALRDDFLVSMSATHRLVPTARQDADNFANAVYRTGANSRATASDRAKLIADLVKSGISAQQAQALVKSFQDKIDALHGKTVPVSVTASGSGGINVAATGLAARIFKLSHLATGGIVPGGYSRTDNQLAWLRSGEGVLQPGAVAALGGPQFIHSANAMFGDVPVPHFDAGGVAGLVPFTANSEGSIIGTWTGQDVQSMLNAMIKQAQAQAGFLGPGSGNYAADIAKVLSAMGLSLSLVPNWLRQIQTESGGNLRAVNLTDSNAQAGHPSVGLLQLIPGTFAAYAGPYRNTPPLVNFGGGFVSEDAMAQIYAGIHYAAARYGSSMGAVIGHGHGYDRGGPILEPVLGVGLRSGEPYGFAMNGVPEEVVPGGGGRSVHVHFDGMVVIREEADLNLLAQKMAFTLSGAGAP